MATGTKIRRPSVLSHAGARRVGPFAVATFARRFGVSADQGIPGLLFVIVRAHRKGRCRILVAGTAMGIAAIKGVQELALEIVDRYKNRQAKPATVSNDDVQEALDLVVDALYPAAEASADFIGKRVVSLVLAFKRRGRKKLPA